MSLKIVIVGHVDHGKSTLIGRLFFDTDSLPLERRREIEASCKQLGQDFEFAYFVDALEEEREHGITIDTTQAFFKSSLRPYVIIDAPGHKEFLKNMVTGAAGAEAAVLLVDAQEGVREQTRRHAYVLSLLGLSQVIVAVNKLDRLDFSQDVFAALEAELREFLGSIGIHPLHVIPLSARSGDNVVHRSERTPWYGGPTLLQALDRLEPRQRPSALPLRMPIQDVYRNDERRLYVGRVESGRLRASRPVTFYPSGKTAVVKSVEKWGEPQRSEAGPGECVGIRLEDERFIERGEVLAEPEFPLKVGRKLQTSLFWLGRAPLRLHQSYILKLTTAEVTARVTEIEERLDSSTLERLSAHHSRVESLEVARVTFTLDRPLAADPYSEVPAMGRFVVVDEGLVAGGGILHDLVPMADGPGPDFVSVEVSLTEADLQELLLGRPLEMPVSASSGPISRLVLVKR